MAGLFPTSIPIREYSLSFYQPTVMSRSQSGRRFSRLMAGHRWEIKVVPEDLDVTEYRLLNGFLMKQQGSNATFTFSLPGYTIGGTIAGSPVVSSVPNDSSVVLTGLSGGDNVKAGDLLTFAGHTKVYAAAEDASESGGSMTVNFEPDLIETPAASEAVEFNSPVFTVHNDDKKISFTRRGVFYSSSFNFIEAY